MKEIRDWATEVVIAFSKVRADAIEKMIDNYLEHHPEVKLENLILVEQQLSDFRGYKTVVYIQERLP